MCPHPTSRGGQIQDLKSAPMTKPAPQIPNLGCTAQSWALSAPEDCWVGKTHLHLIWNPKKKFNIRAFLLLILYYLPQSLNLAMAPSLSGEG